MLHLEKEDRFSERRIDLDKELTGLRKALEDHLEAYKLHETSEKAQFLLLANLVQENVKNTQGLLTAWNNALGTIKVLSIIGEVFKWISVLIVGLGAVWSVLTGKFPQL